MFMAAWKCLKNESILLFDSETPRLKRKTGEVFKLKNNDVPKLSVVAKFRNNLKVVTKKSKILWHIQKTEDIK